MGNDKKHCSINIALKKQQKKTPNVSVEQQFVSKDYIGVKWAHSDSALSQKFSLNLDQDGIPTYTLVHMNSLTLIGMRGDKVQSADLTCDVIKKVAP